MTLLYVLGWSLLLLLRYALCFVQSLNAIILDMYPNTLKMAWEGAILCLCVLLAQKVRNTSLQFSDKLPSFTIDVTLEFENSPVWQTFRFELRIFTQRVCSLADRKCLCVCSGGGRGGKGMKQNFFSSFFTLSITGWNIPEAWIWKFLFKSHHIMETFMVILFLFS